MSNREPQPGCRQEGRIVLTHNPEVAVTVLSDSPVEGPQTHRAQLMDLSPRGARLGSADPISPKKSIRLKLDIEELGVTFYVAGHVCWSKPDEDGTWVLGCSLNPCLPEGVFEVLAKGGQVDRRLEARLEQCVGLEALWELDGLALPVTLQNYSEGGFCVRTREPGRTGTRFHLRLPRPHNLLIVATAVWQLNAADGFLMGCSFLNSRDFERLQRLVGSSASTCLALRQ